MDGAVYAQPLYVSGVTIQGVVRNVLYVATMNDKVYAFNADSGAGQRRRPYHGWIMGFHSTTLTIDANNNVYFATGNNFANAPGAYDGARNFGNSLLKFSVSRTGLSLLSHFTPGNEATLSANDDDLSGSGFTLLPGTNLLLGGGKEGVLYLLNANNLGGKQTGDPQAQRIVVNGGHVMGGPVFWQSPNDGALVYNWSEDDNLIAYQLSGGRLTSPYMQGREISPGHPGGSLIVSANGSTAGTGIVWASMPTNQDAINILTGGILRAYNAETLAQVWTSEQNASRDRVGTLVKFVPPVVANGKVFMASHDGAVAVYGQLPSDFSVSATPASKPIAAGASGTFSVTVGAQSGFTGSVSLTSTGAPSGTTVTFSPQSIAGAGTSTMTVTVPQNISVASFTLTVRGTSGAQSHTATVVVNTSTSPAEIVLYASKASPINGNWSVVAQPKKLFVAPGDHRHAL